MSPFSSRAGWSQLFLSHITIVRTPPLPTTHEIHHRARDTPRRHSLSFARSLCCLLRSVFGRESVCVFSRRTEFKFLRWHLRRSGCRMRSATVNFLFGLLTRVQLRPSKRPRLCVCAFVCAVRAGSRFSVRSSHSLSLDSPLSHSPSRPDDSRSGSLRVFPCAANVQVSQARLTWSQTAAASPPVPQR